MLQFWYRIEQLMSGLDVGDSEVCLAIVQRAHTVNLTCENAEISQ